MQARWQGVGSTRTVTTTRRKPHALLRTLLNLQQHSDKQQQHRGQLRGRHSVVHAEPGFVNARRESLNSKVTGDTKVGQRFHQRQRHAGSHGRPGQRQCHFADTTRQRRTQQAGGLHQMHGTLGQCGSRQQVHIRVKRDRENHHGTAQAAHLRQQPPLQIK